MPSDLKLAGLDPKGLEAAHKAWDLSAEQCRQCEDCAGAGRHSDESQCRTCDGNGWVAPEGWDMLADAIRGYLASLLAPTELSREVERLTAELQNTIEGDHRLFALQNEMMHAVWAELGGEDRTRANGQNLILRTREMRLRAEAAESQLSREARDEVVEALRAIVENHYDEWGVIDVFSASSIVGIDSTGRKQLKGSFIERLEKGRAALKSEQNP